jgi:hypothetical protein
LLEASAQVRVRVAAAAAARAFKRRLSAANATTSARPPQLPVWKRRLIHFGSMQVSFCGWIFSLR